MLNVVASAIAGALPTPVRAVSPIAGHGPSRCADLARPSPEDAASFGDARFTLSPPNPARIIVMCPTGTVRQCSTGLRILITVLGRFPAEGVI